MRRSMFLAGSVALGAAAAPWPVNAAKSDPNALEGRALVPVVRARVGSHDLMLAIDTGDPQSTLSPQAAAALGISGTPVAGAPSLRRATLSGLQISSKTFRDHPLLVTDVTDLRALAGYPIDGSVGYEAFKDYAVTIDYAEGRVTFPTGMPDGETTPITWLKYHDRSPQLVTFDGLNIDGFPVTAQFDTFMSKNAIVFTTKLPDLAVDPDQRAPRYTYEEAALSPGRVGSLKLGTTLLAAHPLVYAADAKAHVPTTAIAAVVGDALFAKRAVTLNFVDSTLIVS
jgi:hypothetical protein